MPWFQDVTSRIYYEIAGKGVPILLLPGFSQSSDDLAMLWDVMVDAGFQVIAADLPGSGRSQPLPRVYPPTYFADDACSFIAFLEHLAVGPMHLMGFSDGGEISLLMAGQNPDIARSVLIWGASGVMSDPDGKLRAAMYNLIDHPLPFMQGYRDHLVATYGEEAARAMTQNVVAGITGVIEQGGELGIATAGNIRCPVLLIVGEHDFFVPMAQLKQLAARIQEPQIVQVDGAGHDAHNAAPAFFERTVVEWLKSH